MMPIMFGVFTWQFPAGLAVYILFSNIIGIFIQYFIGGKQPIMIFGKLYFGTDESRKNYLNKLDDQIKSKTKNEEEEDTDEPKNIQGENSRRSNRRSSKNSRRRSRKS
jgi:membrane protein insertase Oxa1/YidC/SpoIIIJ